MLFAMVLCLAVQRRMTSSLSVVKVTVDPSLRRRLRLVHRHRKPRIFVESIEEPALRKAISKAVPPLQHIDYHLDIAEDQVRVFADEVNVSTPRKIYEGPPYQMLSFYAFFPLEDVDAAVAALMAAWEPLGILGRAYVASEGINAQLAVPSQSMPAFRDAHFRFFQDFKVAQPESGPELNLDREISASEWQKRRAFRRLHVRRRESVVSDGNEDLDLSDPGHDADPAEFHAALDSSKPLLLDVRNHYESAVGTFEGAIPLGTETFKDTYEKLDALLAKVPKNQTVHMFCTGGIRCVKAGAYVKQKLNFPNVTRLKGGIVNYTKYLRDQNEELETSSKFRGINYVFNDRMGEPVTTPLPPPKDELLDARAAEALANVKNSENDAVYEYAERLSGEEPELLWRVRLDAMARYNEGAARMVSGPTQGRLLAMLANIAGSRHVLELGTFCGYGTLWLAKALGQGGRVVTVDRDVRAVEAAKRHFQEKPETWASIDAVHMDTAAFLAPEHLQTFEPFDFVYLDADKKGYAAAVDKLFAAGSLRKGALLIADNTLWKSGVLGVDDAGAPPLSDEDYAKQDAIARENARQLALSRGDDPDDAAKKASNELKTQRRHQVIQQAMHEFNLKIRRDPRLDQLVLPLRDGLTIARVIA